MTSLGALASRLTGGAQFLLGLLVLCTVVPLERPWLMERLGFVECGPALCLRIHPCFTDVFFYVSTRRFVIGCVLLLVLSVSSDGSLRRQLISTLRPPRRLAWALAAFGALALTLYPSDNGVFIVLYLLLGSIGSFWVIRGLSRALAGVVHDSVAERLMEAWRRACDLVMAVPARWFVLTAFIIEFSLTSWISASFFEHIPHVEDSVAQLFHARIFSTGNLTAAPPPLPEFFLYPHMIMGERWYSQYPPGHVLALLPGVILGAPWIINPLLGSLTIALLYPLGKELHDERVARLSVLLGLSSPFVLFMSSEFMNHATGLFAFTLMLIFFARTLRTASVGDGLVAGSSLGWMLITRPLSAACMALPFAFMAAVFLWKQPRRHARSLLTVFGVVLLSAAGLLAYNVATNGSAMLFGYEVLYGPEHGLGFGHSGWGEPHTPELGVEQTLRNLNALNKYLFEWPIPSLIFVVLLFASGQARRWDHASAASFALLVIGYFFYWFQDWCFGPRFLYEATTLLVVMTARGLLVLGTSVGERTGRTAGGGGPAGAVVLTVALSMTVAASSNVPTLAAIYSDRYWDVDGEVLRLVEAARLEDAIVFTDRDYGGVFHALAPSLAGDVIYARDLGERNRALAALFPDRSPWLASEAGLHRMGADGKPASIGSEPFSAAPP